MAHAWWRGAVAAVTLVLVECGHPPTESPLVERTPPPCQLHAPGACRVGCDADEPKRVREVAPDLSGLSVNGLHGLEIVEVLIDTSGNVKDVCLLRGVREDVDGRTVAAVRQWRFEPAQLRHSTPPGLPVSIVMSVSLPIGR